VQSLSTSGLVDLVARGLVSGTTGTVADAARASHLLGAVPVPQTAVTRAEQLFGLTTTGRTP
jgi:hypothetical protein